MEKRDKLYEEYKSYMQRIADVKYASAVLQWDQETYLPPKGAEARGRQLATLSEMAHSMFTDEKFGNLLMELSSIELSEEEEKNVALTFEDYSKQKKFSGDFVRKMSEAVSGSFHAWISARKENDFRVFEPYLFKLVELKKQEADIIGFEDHPYNALMDEFEKGATVKMVDAVFNDVKKPLLNLISKNELHPQPDESFLKAYYSKEKQWDWGMYIARRLGFDFEAGRQDISEHPFTTSFASNDVRITTRIDEHDFSNMTWSTIHEVGHGLYEQGLPQNQYGLPLGEYASLSIHESQSRIWENCVGRGAEFWTYYYPELQKYFPENLDKIDLSTFMQSINKIQPSLIRTEADELTYHIHVMIRYNLEKQLIEGSLAVKDIPVYWNDAYEKYLGVKVPDDKRGCLQDVHWSHGSFGYFATYSLGSFYAAQYWEKANTDIPGLKTKISEAGDTGLLLSWLRENVHQYGRQLTSNELCKKITGSELDSTVFIQYMEDKLRSF